jgi:thiamine transport system ATP-binding protein
MSQYKEFKSGEPVLQIQNLTYTYPAHQATYQFDLHVDPGEIVAILGESGSGKSTLLDLIAGFLEPASGSVMLDGQELLNQSIQKRPITILFQQHNLFEHLNVQTNLLLGIDPKGKATPQALTQIREILQQMKLAEHEHKLPTALSGGQQQRVALGRALLRNQPILLLDEPFSGLDHATRREMLTLVHTLTIQNHLHTLMVTHEPEDAQRIAGSIYKMHDGTLLLQKPHRG